MSNPGHVNALKSSDAGSLQLQCNTHTLREHLLGEKKATNMHSSCFESHWCKTHLRGVMEQEEDKPMLFMAVHSYFINNKLVIAHLHPQSSIEFRIRTYNFFNNNLFYCSGHLPNKLLKWLVMKSGLKLAL